MEPALKQCLDPLTLPNPSAQSNGHLKQEYLLLSLINNDLSKTFEANPFRGTFGEHEIHFHG